MNGENVHQIQNGSTKLTAKEQSKFITGHSDQNFHIFGNNKKQAEAQDNDQLIIIQTDAVVQTNEKSIIR